MIMDLTYEQVGFNVTAEESSLTVAVSEVAEGSLLQLHVEDAQWSQKGIRRCLQVCAGSPGARQPCKQAISLSHAIVSWAP